MRDFYVYGFKSREDYTKKSARSYDDERRRIESWLGGYMAFRHTAEGKNVFISVDNRSVTFNPLHNAWKAKSFTDKDIVLHFCVLDILADGAALRVGEITDGVADYLSHTDTPFEILHAPGHLQVAARNGFADRGQPRCPRRDFRCEDR